MAGVWYNDATGEKVYQVWWEPPGLVQTGKLIGTFRTLEDAERSVQLTKDIKGYGSVGFVEFDVLQLVFYEGAAEKEREQRWLDGERFGA